MQNTDIMIHINELLDDNQRQQLESQLREIPGVIAPRFNKPHLLLVSYDLECTHSFKLLHLVKSKGYQAQLVGL